MQHSASSKMMVPDHELIEVIERGSYGEVWLARNLVGTLRAVKIVRRDRHASIESFDREFKGLQKFEPVSRAHEGLVDILTMGLLPDAAGFYYVMERADDARGDNGRTGRRESDTLPSSRLPVFSPSSYSPRTLRAELKTRGSLPADEVITLGLKLTAALAYLHANGLVHRDVKPSNILFIGGEPKLADAGLVAAMDDARSLVGTAGYIAPEGPGTPQADLYALGKVLYEAAFGKDRQEFPALPADIASRPDHTRLLEINAILLRACATDRRERYQSAEEMRADLELLQRGQSVIRQHAWRRTLSFAKRLVAVCAGLATVSALFYLQALRRSPGTDFKPSSIPEANEEYRLGMIELHNFFADKAIEHFEQAVNVDKNFASAYAQLADAWFSIPGAISSGHGREAAERAVELDPRLGTARAFFAAARMFTLDWKEAEKQNRLALQLSPHSEEVLLACALNFAVMGYTNEALVNLEKAIDLGRDTPSRLRLVYTGFVNQWCRQYDRAITIYNEASWGGYWMHQQQSNAYLAKGDYTNSLRFAKMVALERGEDAKESDALEQAFKEGGQEKYWRRKLEVETKKKSEEHLMNMAAIHARLSHLDNAFQYLRQAMKETPENFSLGINTNPSFDNLRTDQRFQDLLTQLRNKNEGATHGERRR